MKAEIKPKGGSHKITIEMEGQDVKKYSLLKAVANHIRESKLNRGNLEIKIQ